MYSTAESCSCTSALRGIATGDEIYAQPAARRPGPLLLQLPGCGRKFFCLSRKVSITSSTARSDRADAAASDIQLVRGASDACPSVVVLLTSPPCSWPVHIETSCGAFLVAQPICATDLQGLRGCHRCM